MGLNIRHTVSTVKKHLRLRHLRGHGVHSPFVYGLVRNVFMKRRLTDEHDIKLYKELREKGVGKNYCRQLQNLHNYCGYPEFVIGDERGEGIKEECLYVVLPSNDKASRWNVLDTECFRMATVVIMKPDREIKKICDTLIAKKDCTSVDNTGYMIFFYNKILPAQHFKL